MSATIHHLRPAGRHRHAPETAPAPLFPGSDPTAPPSFHSPERLAEYGRYLEARGMPAADMASSPDPLFREMAEALEARPWTR